MQYENRRFPGVSGSFYPARKKGLTDIMERFSNLEKDNIASANIQDKITGGIVPHAGIRYCGRHAVHFFEILRMKQQVSGTVVIIHPNHHGTGPPVSTDGYEYWEVPNGIARVDLDLAMETGLPFSPGAQEMEHSAEVIVPYINHYMSGSIKILSINLLDQGFETARHLAEVIFSAANKLKREIVLIASSDFSHFVSRVDAYERDNLVLTEIERRNTRGVYGQVTGKGLSVCGYGPIMTLMEYSSLVDPEYRVRFLSRGDSGEVTGDSSNVVSYISALFSVKEG